MNQVGLNTLAILVFAITLSVLLGPWLQIPPTLPAGATVVLLGAFTVDTLGFRGQGATLFLDWFAQRSPQYRQRILHHEAGHFLVAHLLDIPVTGYSLSAWEATRQGQPGQGGVTFLPLETDTLAPQLLDRYCTVWMAGAAAEFLVYDSVEGGDDDRQKLRSVVTALRRQWQTQEHRAGLQAKALLEQHWQAYEALVAAMGTRTPVAECCRVIDHHRSPGKSVG
jgi:hypothetical protein